MTVTSAVATAANVTSKPSHATSAAKPIHVAGSSVAKRPASSREHMLGILVTSRPAASETAFEAAVKVSTIE